MSRRLVLAIGLLVLLAGGAVGLYALRTLDGTPGQYRVLVIGPGDDILFDGNVTASDGTVLSALRATGLALDVREYPGMGAYVRGIAGHQASGASGWIYEVGRDGAWSSGDTSAEFAPLTAGDEVRWRWTEGA